MAIESDYDLAAINCRGEKLIVIPANFDCANDEQDAASEDAALGDSASEDSEADAESTGSEL